MKSLAKLFSILNRSKLVYVELILVSLMVLCLPSLEAPKNIFLVLFVIVATIRQMKEFSIAKWNDWDWMFLLIISSALLSTIFAGLAPGDEWKGLRVLLTFISVGWLLSRSRYSINQISWIFWLAILSVIPPLFLGLWNYLVVHSKDFLELHSVGHVNHSAIYLTMIFGSTLGACLSYWTEVQPIKKVGLFILTLLFFVALIIGGSRSAVGIGFFLVVLLMLAHKKLIWLKLSILLIIGLMIISTAYMSKGVMHRQLELQISNQVLTGRSEIWHTTIEAAKLYPLFGIGIDNRANVNETDIKKIVEQRGEIFDEQYYDFHYKHSHSFYLTNIAERGLFGFFVTLFFIMMWFRQLLKTYKQTIYSREAACLWSGSMVAWLTTFGIGFVNTTFHHEHGILACIFLGLHLAFCRNKLDLGPAGKI